MKSQLAIGAQVRPGICGWGQGQGGTEWRVGMGGRVRLGIRGAAVTELEWGCTDVEVGRVGSMIRVQSGSYIQGSD